MNFNPTQIIFERLSQFWISRSMMAIANLGVPDHVNEIPRHINDIAKELSVDSDCLYRLMRGLSTAGFFKETDPKFFSHTPLSLALKTNAPENLRDLVRVFSSPAILEAWAKLEYTIKTGNSAYGDHYSTLFDRLGNEDVEIYNSAMAATTKMQVQLITNAYDFSDIKTLADLGGGYGDLLISILNKNPSQQGILFDLPIVVSKIRSETIDPDIASRLEIRSGDFRNEIPKQCDGYITKNIFHGRSDEDCRELLRKIHRYGKLKSKIFIIEMIVTQDQSEAAKIFDLFLLLAGPNAKVRSESEYKKILSDCNFNFKHTIKADSALSIIVAESN